MIGTAKGGPSFMRGSSRKDSRDLIIENSNRGPGDSMVFHSLCAISKYSVKLIEPLLR